MFKKLAFAGFALAVATGASAQAQPKLFKDYAYDSPQSAYTQAQGFEDCSDWVGKPALCRDGATFLGEDFSEALVFTNGKLRMVTLYTHETDGLVDKVVTAMAKSFVMTIFANGKTEMDLIKLASSAKNREEVVNTLTSFQSEAVASGNYSATFIESFELPKKKPTDVIQLMMAAPENVRIAQLQVMGDANGESTVMVRFAYPKLDSKAAAKQVKAADEAF
ncbi:hypothetical protein [Pseudomonas entomophila]|uniref:hypothetical protein n=1 Tax=Pseudomonas entomophila TaxID=312306 RepID=UPI001F025795|nr:hypothetical protein [Pseudomonas entomophila]MCG8296447.1 hypothetical protein [Pseudomonas entomophila]